MATSTFTPAATADPIISGNKVFISSGYNRGCALFQFDGSKTTKLWENKNMRNHFNSCVLIDGHLYGMDGDHGRKDSTLTCIEFESGNVKSYLKGEVLEAVFRKVNNYNIKPALAKV